MSKYKVGDKVKFVRTAAPIRSLKEDIGKIGTVIKIFPDISPINFLVNIPDSVSQTARAAGWILFEYEIEPIHSQLLFDFMDG